MGKKSPHSRKLLSDKPIYLLALSIFLYVLIYFYHGFVAFGGDTIETVPYALWMSDNSLFPFDFHIGHISEIFPNERWLISWILHLFPDHIFAGSLILHFFFSVFLISGMIRLADIILGNIELSILAVFITLFSLYNINTGSNELYYNMFVSSLAAKGIGIWALVNLYEKRLVRSSIFLSICTFLHPLVGLQLFAVFSALLVFVKILKIESFSWKDILKFLAIFLLTGGIWVGFILGAQGPKTGNIHLFFDIVEFRIAHHFFPAYFPKTHVLFMLILGLFSSIYFYRKSKILFFFFLISGLGILLYIIGIQMEIELFLSSQWMKITIWLKFLSIIAIISWIQSLLETKYQRLIFLIGFLGALAIALMRFNPKYDKDPPLELYSWILSNSEKEDVFLVPPQLADFKYRTKRSSYFDFKAMLHHRPEIYEWADRFEEVYGITIADRSINDDIFGKVKSQYALGRIINSNSEIDFFIIPNLIEYKSIVEKFESKQQKPLFLDEEYIIYGKEEK